MVHSMDCDVSERTVGFNCVGLLFLFVLYYSPASISPCKEVECSQHPGTNEGQNSSRSHRTERGTSQVLYTSSWEKNKKLHQILFAIKRDMQHELWAVSAHEMEGKAIPPMMSLYVLDIGDQPCHRVTVSPTFKIKIKDIGYAESYEYAMLLRVSTAEQELPHKTLLRGYG